MNLPNFMCIGAAKSGTTSLYDILRQHSNVFIPSFKEPHFFDIPFVYSNGIKWYSKTYFKSVNKEKYIADFTPTYLFEKNAAKRIYKDLGSKMKFIIILRNPVDRAYSHYLHSKRDQHDKLTFKEALELENERISTDDYLSKLRFSYINQGFYFKMLNEYFQVFPKENFLIINFEEEFVEKRKETIDKVFSFLELEKEQIDIDLNSNKASEARFVWVKKLMKKTGFWRVILKSLIPSLKIRQIIKNNLQRANTNEYIPKALSQTDKKAIFETYFKQDVVALEKLIDRKMNWNL